MEICSICGAEFDLTRVKRRIGRLYGPGEYNNYFPGGNVCDHCAVQEMSADFNAGKDDRENMGSGWD